MKKRQTWTGGQPTVDGRLLVQTQSALHKHRQTWTGGQPTVDDRLLVQTQSVHKQ